jgi:Glycosyl hydrolase catalytic core
MTFGLKRGDEGYLSQPMRHERRGSRARLGSGAIAVALASAALLVPATQAGAVGGEFFGVVPAGSTSASEFGTMGDANVGTYRFQLSWRDVQPDQGGSYDWSGVDARVTNAALNGIELLPFVYGTPDWAGASPSHPPRSGEAKRAWKQFLIAAAERYGPGGEFWQSFTATPRPIETWQILNEENSPTYYKPKPSPKDYAKLVKISDEALHDVDPGADIVLGGMFGTPSPKRAIHAWTFLKRLYKVKRVERHFDAVALHPYSPNLAGIKAQIELAREKLKQAGDGKVPIFITELGWGSAGTKGFALIKSRAGQKKLLRKSFNLVLNRRGKWKVKRLLWFAWRDPATGSDSSGAVCSWCASAGLLEQDEDPKPSFEQYRKFTGAG